MINNSYCSTDKAPNKFNIISLIAGCKVRISYLNNDRDLMLKKCCRLVVSTLGLKTSICIMLLILIWREHLCFKLSPCTLECLDSC